MKCVYPGCPTEARPEDYLCSWHDRIAIRPPYRSFDYSLPVHHRPTRSADYEAARLDPTTDRDRWDVWDDGGLEGPGGDEW